MMKLAKKVLGLLIATVLVLTVGLPVFAVTVGEISGDANLFAPPTDTKTQINYKLLETAGDRSSAVADAIFSVSGSLPDGVYVDESGAVALDGANVKPGSFTLSARSADGSVIATKTITIPDVRFDYDYENLTPSSDGTKVHAPYKAKKLSDGTYYSTAISGQSGSSAGVAAEANGNKYVAATGYTNYMQADLATRFTNNSYNILWQASKTVTMDAMVKMPGTSTYSIKDNSKNAFYLRANNYAIQENHVNDEGTANAGWANAGANFTADWNNLRVEFDFNTKTYDAYINGVLFLDDNRMGNGAGDYLGSPYFETSVDDVAFYSGKLVKSGITADVPSTVYAGSKGVMMPLSASHTIGDVKVGGEIAWSVNGSAGVSVDNGYLIVEPATVGENVTLTASSAGENKEFTVTIAAATENDYSGEAGGCLAADATADVSLMGGIISLKASVRGENAALRGLGADIPLSLGNTEFASLSVYLDTNEKSYIVIVDGKKVDRGEYTSVSSLTVADGELLNLYCGNTYKEAPFALDAKISGATVLGSSLSVDYSYYSPIELPESEKTVKWYINDSLVKTDENFLIGSDMLSKNVKAEIIVTGGGLSSESVFTLSAVITDIFTAEITASGVSLNVSNTGDEMNFIAAAEWFSGGASLGVTAKKVSSSEDNISVALAKPSAFDGVRVWLMNTDFSPLSVSKSLGSGGKNVLPSGKTEEGITAKGEDLYIYDRTGQMITVVVYRPLGENDFVNHYTKDNISVSTRDTVLTDKILYMDVTNADIKLGLSKKENGIHFAQVIPASGTQLTLKLALGMDALFTEDVLKAAADADDGTKFANILDKCAGIDSDEAQIVFNYYKKADKSDVKTLMAAENYDLSKFKTASLLAAFMQDKLLAENLKTELLANSYNAEAVELVCLNNSFSTTIDKIDLTEGISKCLDSMKEKAILEGIKTASNYQETKKYLKAVGDYEISNSMAIDFTGESFDSLAELAEEIEDYKPESSGGSGGGGGGSSSGGSKGGNLSGIVSSGASGGSSSSVSGTNGGNGSKFSDVLKDHWASADIDFLVSRNILNGMPDGTFAPEKNITRAEFVKILYSAFDILASGDDVEFNDVSENDWFYDYVSFAGKSGIVTGDNGEFRPHDAIKREDAAVMLYRVLTKVSAVFGEGESEITDEADISPYAKEAVNALYGKKIINGYEDGSFLPNAPITRAQTAAIVARVLR